MRDYKHWGVKMRYFPEHNYKALWFNLKTIRLGEGKSKELPPNQSEFYDVSLGNKCQTGKCNFCYVSSNPDGKFYEDICETWKKWIETSFYERVENGITITNKPFQIAIGSEGSADEHEDFCMFLKTVYDTGVVPNYTTNGVILSNIDNPSSKWYTKANEILNATISCCGGVAVSFGNKYLRNYAKKAVNILISNKINTNIHHLISTKESVDEFVKEWLEYGDSILYHVLLPLMSAGRSTKGVEEGVFEYLEEVIEKNNIKNVAFGAHFIKSLRTSKIKTWLYDEESFCKNIILEKDCVKITPSSFNLNPIQIINL